MHSTPSRTLNIGILAHVDAGKTSLTERILYDTGVIDRLGSVDTGDTRTDTGEIERRRGITIRSAVASFTVGDTRVNLIDTPGHADFIAEVERALGVLDGAVLLLSAVEGVQAQTRVLMRTLRRMRLPTLLFLNKIDRAGARDGALLDEVRERLAPCVVPLTRVRDAGTGGARAVPLALGGAAAEVLAEADDEVLARVVDGPAPGPGELRAALAARTADGTAHPLVHGSALSGEGVGPLLDALTRYVRAAPPDGSAVRGTVFAVRPEGAYLRLWGGRVTVRQRLTFLRDGVEGRVTRIPGRVTALDVVGGGGSGASAGRSLVAGGIGVLRGVPGLRVGDRLGEARGPGARFARPTLETVVTPKDPARAAGLRAALLALADQDPLIHTRAGAASAGGGTVVSLYGEVQKQVLAATLADEHGIEAEFAPSRVVCLERPVGTGEAHEEILRHGHMGEMATVGLRVEPGARGSGRVFGYETELGALPRAFHQAVEDTVLDTLGAGAGPHGWPVTDVRVTLVRSGFASPVSTAGDFRAVARRVLGRALKGAGTRVYEPCHAFEAEIPLDALARVTSLLTSLGAELTDTVGVGAGAWLVTGTMTAAHVPEAERGLPSLTRGEALWTSHPEGDRAV